MNERNKYGVILDAFQIVVKVYILQRSVHY